MSQQDDKRDNDYLCLKDWRSFLRNDWRHLKWEVHIIAVAVLAILGLLVNLFTIAMNKLFP